MIAPGTIVGDKYELDAPIGQGGMATVWRAVHTTLDRPVAVKFLEAVGTHSQQLAARFLQEAKLAAGLRHRHVVDILDFGVVDTGQPFMVMELLEGQSLADRYTEGPPVSDWELMEIVAMTLSGLAAVHDAGIMHRDVKPENVFLVEDADGIYPKLLDFGVSRGLGGGARFTKTGAVVGTPQYMSPEQARGKKDIDHRSDLWSVGVLLYEGFTGEVPFDSENPGDVLIMVATEEAPPLSESRPDLPAGVIDLVHTAMSKDPAQRFQTAREMREALLAVLEGVEELNGRPPSTVIRTSYSSTGTGKLRVLSAPPGMPEVAPPPSGAIRTDRQDATPPEFPSVHQVEDDEEGRDSGELSTARLPPPRPLPSGRGARPAWLLPAIALAIVLLGAGGFLAFGGLERVTSGGTASSGARGAVRPGEAVAPPVTAAASEEPEGPVELAPPPTEGLPAPEAETVDVPSPPDPPEVSEEAELGLVGG